MFVVAGVILLVALLAGGTWLLLRAQPAAVTERNIVEAEYMRRSSFEGVQSRFHIYEDEKQSSTLEYPVTQYDGITEAVKKVIDEAHREFTAQVESLPVAESRYIERISYQVPFQSDEVMSILVSISQDTRGANPLSETKFWTFSKETEAEITLADITDSNEDVVLSAIKQDIERQTEAAGAVIGADYLDQSVTSERVQQFVIRSSDRIEFPFGRGEVAPRSSGELTVSLTVDSIKSALQNDTARAIFDVPRIEEPTPAPTPAPVVPPTTSANCDNCVALTFDDGPGPYTNELLDTLDQYNAKASFFIIGSGAANYPSVIKRQFDSGHTVANHTFTHPDLRTLPTSAITSEVTQTTSAIQSAGGGTPRFIRPPYGAYNDVATAVFQSQNLASVIWSIDTRDWADRDSNIICHRATTGIRAGSIILMHDIHPTTVNAVPCILDGLRGLGLRPVSLDTLLGTPRPGATYFSAD